MSRSLTMLVAAGLLAGAAPHAGSKPQACDVAAMRAAAEAYMPANVEGAYDPSVWDDVPLAPNARRVEHPPGTYNGTPARGGPLSGKSGEQIKTWSTSLPTLRVTTAAREYDRPDRQMFDPEACEFVAFWLIDLGARSPAGGAVTNFGTVHVAERFGFDPDTWHITQIDAIFFHSQIPNESSCWPAAGSEGQTGGCTTSAPPAPTYCAPGSDQQQRAAVQSYLKALTTHDASQVALADDVRRTEMPWPAGTGPVTATNAEQVRTSLANDLRFTRITAVRDQRWFVNRSDCTVVVFYLLDATQPSTTEPGEPGVPYTVHVAERYHVSRGKIVEIEQIAYPHQNRQPEGSCWTGFDNEKTPAGSPEDQADYAYFTIPCPAGY